MKKNKLLKTIAMSLTMVTLTGSLLACSGGGDDENKATKEAATTKKVEATTEEVTTEKPTEYVYKGLKREFEADSSFGKFFANRTLKPGDKIVINELCDQSLSPSQRGIRVGNIIIMIYSTFYPDLATKFSDKYLIPGTTGFQFSYEDNFVIEYEGDKPIMFKVVKEEAGKVYLDIYLLD